jgi:hypothetical protein
MWGLVMLSIYELKNHSGLGMANSLQTHMAYVPRPEARTQVQAQTQAQTQTQTQTQM